MPTAQPDPDTKMLTALCLNCGQVVYKWPHMSWRHDSPTGDWKCADDE